QRRRLAGFGNMIDPEHRYLPHRRRLPQESERRANSALVMHVSLFVIGGQALMTNGEGKRDRPSRILRPRACTTGRGNLRRIVRSALDAELFQAAAKRVRVQVEELGRALATSNDPVRLFEDRQNVTALRRGEGRFLRPGGGSS